MQSTQYNVNHRTGVEVDLVALLGQRYGDGLVYSALWQ